jgi:hypothetical protein
MNYHGYKIFVISYFSAFFLNDIPTICKYFNSIFIKQRFSYILLRDSQCPNKMKHGGNNINMTRRLLCQCTSHML